MGRDERKPGLCDMTILEYQIFRTRPVARIGNRLVGSDFTESVAERARRLESACKTVRRVELPPLLDIPKQKSP